MGSIASDDLPPAHADARTRQSPLIWLDGPAGAGGQVQALTDLLGWPAWTPARTSGDETLGSALAAFRQAFPDRPLLRLASGIRLQAQDAVKLARLLEEDPPATAGAAPAGRARVISCLSNHAPWSNPFATLAVSSMTPADADEDPTGLFANLAALIGMLGTGGLFPADAWPRHLQLFSVAAIEALALPSLQANHAIAALRQAGGELLIADHVFAADPAVAADNAAVLQAQDERRPPAWGSLVERVAGWLSSQAALPDYARNAVQPVHLHITHSWGGGVARWVESFIDGAHSAGQVGQHLQLRAEGPQPGAGTGQRLALYAGNELRVPIAHWWLSPAIQSCVDHHPQYCEILTTLVQRYGIGRIIVSSLVGHCLEVFRSGLPTVQVLHDFFPLWPLLGVHPEPYLELPPQRRLDAALQQHRLLPDFDDRNASQWHQLAQQWRATLAQQRVDLVAPSQSTARLVRALDPHWQDLPIEVIHHGLPPLPASGAIRPRPRADGRLRLVVPGRMQPGKGRDLLLAALPRLTEMAQIYLLGAGQDAAAFFGLAGVNVVVQYQRGQLGGLLQAIGPDAALLLSVVPETFSYTLSEMQQLGVAVVATRVGSLAERITHEQDGWLIAPQADELVERVRQLAADRTVLDQVRARLRDIRPVSIATMLARYDALCPPAAGQPAAAAPGAAQNTQAGAAAAQNAWLRASNSALTTQAGTLQAEVEKRTQWARTVERTLRQEQIERDRWAAALQAEIDATVQSLRHSQQKLTDEEANLAQEKTARLRIESDYRSVKAEHDLVLQSSSWRLTRPLRVARRMLANLSRARAWNPLRWPLLLSQSVRIIITQGWRGALLRAQTGAVPNPPVDSSTALRAVDTALAEAPAAVPCPQQPQVSIIIPVFNQWRYTASCLQSLVSTRSKASFEVIVVDDCSSDATGAELAQIHGVIAIRNATNGGFIKSCNRGLAAARGDYVVLLNNDTQVLDGWLDALLDTFARYPDTGLAGARLLYPDGSLQEAGGIIFNDGSGWNYGRGDEPGRPEYNFVREADYCSGACIMLRTDLLRELGGLDTRYAPAYYEDTDLAFRVRAAGLKVRVQPAANIIHHEGISSGTDPASGTKRYQAINRQKFQQRWAGPLAGLPAPIVDPGNQSSIRRARDHRLKGRVLVIDAYTPEPDQDSGSVRLTSLFDLLQQLGYGVTFFADNRACVGRYTVALQQAGVEVLHNPWLASMQDFFRDRGPEFDYVIISRHYVAANYLTLLRRYCPAAKFIFDTVDLHYLREQRLAELESSLPLQRVAAQTKRSEMALIRAADATLVVSQFEAGVLAREAPDSYVHVLSNIHQVQPGNSSYADRKDVFFVGGYQHPPNVDAAIWFVHDIWPLIQRQLPGVRFHLIGSKAPESVRSLAGEGVIFHGFVPDLQPWLEGCRLAVAPLRYGAGIKGKVNLSMSCGQPVVATPAAVEGLYSRDGEELLIAGSEQEFAAAVVRLYNDEALWNRLSSNGMENVRRYFSAEAARASLERLFEALDERGRMGSE